MRYIAICTILSLVIFTTAYGQSHENNTNETQLVPYTDNSNVGFTFENRIDYDFIIAKIMPDIFEKKFSESGITINSEDVVLNRGPRILGYLPNSYNCGYVIDSKEKVYWLEAAINSTHIQYANFYEEIPQERTSEETYLDCFYPLEIKVAEYFLKDKSYFTDDEELLVASHLKHELRGNENLNHYKFKIGKFNLDSDKQNLLRFCGMFEGKMAGSKYFVGTLHETGQLGFSLDSKMSSICAIRENASLYDSKFKEKPNSADSLQTWKNIRNEPVYLKSSSTEKILERNYMKTESIPNLNLEYATSIKVDFIDYRPEESGTLLYFEPTEQDTFAKFRVPQNGANYYMHYGPNDWNSGDITNVVISVGEDDPEFKKQSFVKSPNAPYPQYFTDYIFNVPKGSTMMAIVLDIENYKIDEDQDLDEWKGRDLRKSN
ncbi:MAG: hypothetical protein ACW9W3_06345 [Candidatus Nitrosopumilus sp. bin_68KS]